MLTDPVTIFYDPKRERFRLRRGRETFYNERNEMLEWETEEEAKAWAFQQGLSLEIKNENK